jgi:hypothetical protein
MKPWATNLGLHLVINNLGGSYKYLEIMKKHWNIIKNP